MNLMNHTPGPWLIDHIRGRYRVRINGRGWGSLARVIVRMDGDVEDSPEGMANARLIAAAPDLLEACLRALPFLQALRDGLSENAPDHDPRLYKQAAIDMIEAAVAKVRGDS